MSSLRFRATVAMMAFGFLAGAAPAQAWESSFEAVPGPAPPSTAGTCGPSGGGPVTGTVEYAHCQAELTLDTAKGWACNLTGACNL